MADVSLEASLSVAQTSLEAEIAASDSVGLEAALSAAGVLDAVFSNGLWSDGKKCTFGVVIGESTSRSQKIYHNLGQTAKAIVFIGLDGDERPYNSSSTSGSTVRNTSYVIHACVCRNTYEYTGFYFGHTYRYTKSSGSTTTTRTINSGDYSKGNSYCVSPGNDQYFYSPTYVKAGKPYFWIAFNYYLE